MRRQRSVGNRWPKRSREPVYSLCTMQWEIHDAGNGVNDSMHPSLTGAGPRARA